MLIVTTVAILASILIYLATGGHFVFFALPLVFGLPLLGRRNR